MICPEGTMLKFLFTLFIFFFVGFTANVIAQVDTVQIEEAIPVQEPDVATPQDCSKSQAVSDTIPDQSFITPNYGSVRDVYNVSEVPNPKSGNGDGYISDPNDYLSASEERQINNIL